MPPLETLSEEEINFIKLDPHKKKNRELYIIRPCRVHEVEFILILNVSRPRRPGPLRGRGLSAGPFLFVTR
jgi:hypothetical protein